LVGFKLAPAGQMIWATNGTDLREKLLTEGRFYDQMDTERLGTSKPVWCGVSKGVEDGCRPPILQAGHPQISRKAVSGVDHPQNVEMADLGETLGSL
jgi:hypothetical protein